MRGSKAVLYVNSSGVCSALKPPPRVIVGADRFRFENVEIEGVYSLEAMKWAADMFTRHSRIQFQMISVR